ncbi:MAG: hypothetical protein V2A54_08295 [Bacteroidota bacterium]
MMKEKKQILIGALLGLVAPIVILFIFYLLAKTNDYFWVYIRGWVEYGIFTKMFSLCLLANLGLFFLFLWREKMYHARGVLTSTILWGIFIFIIYFL